MDWHGRSGIKAKRESDAGNTVLVRGLVPVTPQTVEKSALPISPWANSRLGVQI
jgi:hypothetical protein